MAKRPVYIPNKTCDFPRVIIREIEFKWFPGMSKSQKQKSIESLHSSSHDLGIKYILEISSKSENDLGIKLSAFNLTITTKKQRRSFSVETAFQSSKVFENGGPYCDLLDVTSQQAKKDIRLKESGNLVKFLFFGKEFSSRPKTLFYDWLYINALHQNKELSEKIMDFEAFTDIEFNPQKSLNCQAYSAALYVSLKRTESIDEAIESPESFLKILANEYSKRDGTMPIQGILL